MQFGNAGAFQLLLLFIPLAVLKIVGDWSERRRLLRIVAPRLLSRLRQGGWRGRALLVFSLELLGLALLIAAVARPQWGHTESESTGFGRSIIIAVDTSRSMLGSDISPDRLTRAKIAAQELIAALPGDKVGLIAFAGRAFLQAPLTTDQEALIETLSEFDVDLIPRGGTNLAEPIRLAAEVFDKSGTANHALIMFSDGEELEGSAIEATKAARDQNIMIITVGVGTRAGSLLPAREPRRAGEFMRDEAGRIVRSRLEDPLLEALARETRGLYLSLSSSSLLKERIQVILAKLDRSRTQALKAKRQPTERYRWVLVPGLLCLLAAFMVKMGRRLRSVLPLASVRQPATGSAAAINLESA